ncbi:putative RNA recognition motif containing protein [Lyophyllum shimeji]|uniref:RNA recognition motif containing protein n=1 Tax=Lyophyllum shimeji TaxID=47721 RepID=A0A9P3USW3_LYOSH|nr:putative RNA recognition motif containing protein [Lyophyllum shimeji]
MMNGQPYARLNNFHGPKRQLLGNQAGLAAPAWKTNVPPQVSVGKGKQVMEQGSKIFLSRLPLDVTETEIEELFRKTVGPLKESFLIYNSQGRSKGMAVVSFQRPGDAAVARAKYDGKIVDGRRPLKIEIITDGTTAAMGPPPVPSLLNRLGVNGTADKPVAKGVALPTQPRSQNARPPARTQSALAPVPGNIPVPPRRVRQKKGPKRIKKRQAAAVTKDQLDKEMEDYRAAADMLGLL